MKTSRIGVIVLAVLVVGVGIYAGYSYYHSDHSNPLIVYSADAYVAESNYLLSGYHNASGASVLKAKGGGSFTDAREISQGDPANAFISVSRSSYEKSYLGPRYSGWAVAFASDQLVLAYTSEYSNLTEKTLVKNIVDQFGTALENNNPHNYSQAYNNLTSGKVTVGISNPSSDPAGLRGWISLEIAGKLYAGNENYYTTAIMKNQGVRNSTSAAELVSPLTTGNIQFLFIYRSVAVSEHLPFIELSNYTNFGNASMASFYSGFSYNTASGAASGSPILLLVSSLAGNGVLNGTSLNFTVYVVEHSNEMASFGLTPLVKPVLYNDTSVPSPIETLLSRGKITSGGTI